MALAQTGAVSKLSPSVNHADLLKFLGRLPVDHDDSVHTQQVDLFVRGEGNFSNSPWGLNSSPILSRPAFSSSLLRHCWLFPLGKHIRLDR